MRYIALISALTVALGPYVTAARTSRDYNLLPRNSIQANPGDATYDYVVVGGGTAGLAMAARLSEDSSKSVAIIEAGTYYENFGNVSEIPLYGPSWTGKDPAGDYPEVDWKFVTEPQAVSTYALRQEVSRHG